MGFHYNALHYFDKTIFTFLVSDRLFVFFVKIKLLVLILYIFFQGTDVYLRKT